MFKRFKFKLKYLIGNGITHCHKRHIQTLLFSFDSYKYWIHAVMCANAEYVIEQKKDDTLFFNMEGKSWYIITLAINDSYASQKHVKRAIVFLFRSLCECVWITYQWCENHFVACDLWFYLLRVLSTYVTYSRTATAIPQIDFDLNRHSIVNS